MGVFAPLAACLLKAFSSLGSTMHPLGLYVIAAAANLVLIRFFYRQELDQSARGTLMITFVALILLIVIDKPSLI